MGCASPHPPPASTPSACSGSHTVWWRRSPAITAQPPATDGGDATHRYRRVRVGIGIPGRRHHQLAILPCQAGAAGPGGALVRAGCRVMRRRRNPAPPPSAHACESSHGPAALQSVKHGATKTAMLRKGSRLLFACVANRIMKAGLKPSRPARTAHRGRRKRRALPPHGRVLSHNCWSIGGCALRRRASSWGDRRARALVAPICHSDPVRLLLAERRVGARGVGAHVLLVPWCAATTPSFPPRAAQAGDRSLRGQRGRSGLLGPCARPPPGLAFVQRPLRPNGSTNALIHVQGHLRPGLAPRDGLGRVMRRAGRCCQLLPLRARILGRAWGLLVCGNFFERVDAVSARP